MKPNFCDFCNTTENLNWKYTATKFAIQTNINAHSVVFESDEYWAACDDCHRLIEERNREAITLKALTTAANMNWGSLSNIPEKLKRDMERLHKNFFKYKKGVDRI